jgi:hypothetical protein
VIGPNAAGIGSRESRIGASSSPPTRDHAQVYSRTRWRWTKPARTTHATVKRLPPSTSDHRQLMDNGPGTGQYPPITPEGTYPDRMFEEAVHCHFGRRPYRPDWGRLKRPHDCLLRGDEPDDCWWQSCRVCNRQYVDFCFAILERGTKARPAPWVRALGRFLGYVGGLLVVAVSVFLLITARGR